MAKSAAERAISLVTNHVEAQAGTPRPDTSLLDQGILLSDPEKGAETIRGIEYLFAELHYYYAEFQQVLRGLVELYNQKCLADGEPETKVTRYGELNLEEIELQQLTKPYTSEHFYVAYNVTLFEYLMDSLWKYGATSWQQLLDALYAIQQELAEVEEVSPKDKPVLKELIEDLEKILGGALGMLMAGRPREGFDARYKAIAAYFLELEKLIRTVKSVSLTEDQQDLLRKINADSLSRPQMIAILNVANEIEGVAPTYGVAAGQSMTPDSAVAFSQLFWEKIAEALGPEYMEKRYYGPIEARDQELANQRGYVIQLLEGMRGINQVEDGILGLQGMVGYFDMKHLEKLQEAITTFSTEIAAAHRQSPPFFKREVKDVDRKRITAKFWQTVELLVRTLLPTKDQTLRNKIETILVAISQSKPFNQPH